jgi:hypothetical protein
VPLISAFGGTKFFVIRCCLGASAFSGKGFSDQGQKQGLK